MPKRVVLILAFLIATWAASPAGAQDRRSVPDPDGGPAWTAQVRSEDRAGEQCVVVAKGRTGKGRFCERLSRTRVFEYTVRREIGDEIDPQRWRTVFVVNLSPSIERATLTTPDGVVTYRRGRGPRVLFAVLRGDLEQARLEAELRRGGTTRTIVAGRPAALIVADPVATADPWGLVRGVERGCVRWERVRRYTPRSQTLPRGPERCGRVDAPIGVAVADRAADRVVVTGVTRADVRSVALRGPSGAVTRLRRDERTGGFLAVLAGQTDANALTVVATLRDGRQVTRAVAAAR